MAEQGLQGLRILIVEDEYLIADDICQALQDAGAEILGPSPTVSGAAALVAAEAAIDAALLDINLRGEPVFEVADTLLSRGIPFAFATGYDHWAIPARFGAVPRLEKPFKAPQILAALQPLFAATVR
jgi:CheY-like chemotaxis protein